MRLRPSQGSSSIPRRVLRPQRRIATAGSTPPELRAAVRAIDEIYEELTKVNVDAALARAAGELAERRALRGYDAVHPRPRCQSTAPTLCWLPGIGRLPAQRARKGLWSRPAQPDRA